MEGIAQMSQNILGRRGLDVGAGIVWIATYFVVRGVLEMPDLGRNTRIAIALSPAIPAGLFLLAFMHNIKTLGELELKVQLEAFAFAFPLTVFLLMFLGLMQLAIDLDMNNWSYRHVWTFVPIFYLAGLALAWRKYK